MRTTKLQSILCVNLITKSAVASPKLGQGIYSALNGSSSGHSKDAGMTADAEIASICAQLIFKGWSVMLFNHFHSLFTIITKDFHHRLIALPSSDSN